MENRMQRASYTRSLGKEREDYEAGQMAQQFLAEQAAMREQARRAQEAEMLRNAGREEGLAAGLQHAYNSLVNTPNGMPGYRMPAEGDVGPSSYKRPAVVPQEQGLAAKIMQYLGGK